MEKRQRKPTRLVGYDYSATGYYFVTLCTKHRQKILSNIVGVDVTLLLGEMSQSDKEVMAKP